MYWENVALMSIGVADLRKGRANLVDDHDGLSVEREQKHVFAMSL
jgi:hypothetical protein